MKTQTAFPSVTGIATSLLLAVATPLWAQSQQAEVVQVVSSPSNPFLRGLGVVAIVAAVWFFCYLGLYPWLRKHYSDGASRAIFWPMFLLWLVTGLHLSFYLIFDYGFYFGWIRIVAIFFAVVFSLWFLVSFARRAQA